MENKNAPNEWKLHDLSLGQLNVIVSKNAAGKTRCVNAIRNLAMSLSGKVPRLFDGHSNMQFLFNNKNYSLELNVANNQVLKESFKNDTDILVERNDNEGQIKSFRENKTQMIAFDPPIDKLTTQVRRDKKEFPYLELLFAWADNTVAIRFAKLFPSNIVSFGNSEMIISGNEDGLNLPYMLSLLAATKEGREGLINSFNAVGFKIKNIEVGRIQVPDKEAPIIIVNEKGLRGTLPQFALSAGMFRSIATVITIAYLLARNDKSSTILIDDLGEGLDFARSNLLARWIYNAFKKTNFQLIATSNDFFLLNAIKLEYWNVLERDGHEVFARNQKNRPEEFKEFKFTGLNNFEFFSSDFFK